MSNEYIQRLEVVSCLLYLPHSTLQIPFNALQIKTQTSDSCQNW